MSFAFTNLPSTELHKKLEVFVRIDTGRVDTGSGFDISLDLHGFVIQCMFFDPGSRVSRPFFRWRERPCQRLTPPTLFFQGRPPSTKTPRANPITKPAQVPASISVLMHVKNIKEKVGRTGFEVRLDFHDILLVLESDGT